MDNHSSMSHRKKYGPDGSTCTLGLGCPYLLLHCASVTQPSALMNLRIQSAPLRLSNIFGRDLPAGIGQVCSGAKHETADGLSFYSERSPLVPAFCNTVLQCMSLPVSLSVSLVGYASDIIVVSISFRIIPI